MTLPPNTGLTIVEVRRLAATLAVRRGIPFDRTLIEDIEALAEDIILADALRAKPNTGGTT